MNGMVGMPYMQYSGVSDTGAAPDNSGGSMINIGGGGVGSDATSPGMHPM